jgi:dienelactone hydrolase
VAAAAALEWAVPSAVVLLPPVPRAGGAVALVAASVPVDAAGVRLMVRAFYAAPAGAAAALRRAPYLVHGGRTAAGLGALMKLPRFAFAWLAGQGGLFFDAGAAPPAPAPPPPPSPSPRLRVALFFHGLGGVPDVYSSLTADLASRGWLVLAPEFCDGSAAFAAPPDGAPRSYAAPSAATAADAGALYRLRAAQLRQRVAEAAATLDLALWLARDGGGGEPYGAAGAALRAALRGAVDARAPALVGHSFGAATALALAAADARPRAVAALDSWMHPLSPDTLRAGVAHAATLSVCGDDFTAWRANAAALKALLSPPHRAPLIARDDDAYAAALAAWDVAAAAGPTRGNGVAPATGELLPHLVAAPRSHANGRNLLLTLRGAEHQNFSDAAVTFGRVIRWLGLTGPLPPHDALRAVREVVHAFIDAHAREDAPPAPAAPGAALDALRLPADVRANLCASGWALGATPPRAKVLKNP